MSSTSVEPVGTDTTVSGGGAAPSDGGRADRPAPRARLGLALGQNAGLLGALIVLCVVLALTAPNFLTATNLKDVARQLSFTGIIAFGMTFVIIAGEIDISVGSAIAFGSALLGVLVAKHGWGIETATVAVLVAGTAIGVVAGFLRARLGIPSFIVTLALFSSLKGLALLITDAAPQPILDDGWFTDLGTGDLLGVPVPAWIMFVVFATAWFVLNRTTFGRSVYAIGGNAEAAHLSGIPVARVRTSLFAISGLLAACSAILLSSSLSTGTASIGSGVEFSVISAVIVGGASLYGGRGTMVGTLLGVVFISVLGNGMVLLGVNVYAQQVAYGLIVLVAVLVSQRPALLSGQFSRLLGLRAGRPAGADQAADR